MPGEAEGAAGTALAGDAGKGSDAAAAAAGAGDAKAGDAAAAGAGDAKAGDAKPAEGTKGEQGKDGKTDAPKLHGAPESYSEFKMPDGVEPDKALIEKATPLLKAFNLSQDGAQQAVDFITELRQADAKALTDAADKQWADTVDGWEKQAKEDAEIGGAKYDEAKSAGLKAVGAFLKTPDEHQAWAEFCNVTGVGNHPVLRKLLARIGAGIKEDKTNGGKTADTGQLSDEQRAQRIYTTMGPQNT